MDETVDFVIIGSGFGGSVAAMRLAEKGYSVVVLERGRRYGAEDFPKTNWNVRRFLWLPAARCFGIMGIHFLNDMLVLNGSGVGGGSLVYAATLIQPGQAFFEAEEWRDLADWEAELAPHYETARRMLGVTANPRRWPADEILYEIATELGREQTFESTPVGIYFGIGHGHETGPSKGQADGGHGRRPARANARAAEIVADPYFGGEGPARGVCTHCGGCMVGCRHGAKNSLDKNYLYFAEKWGAEIWAESEARDIRPLPEGEADGARYEVIYRPATAWLYKRERRVRARNVVVSAGVLGTVDLLLRCRDETKSLPRLSPRLGCDVRSNSEALMGVTARKGSESRDFSQGVAITSHFWIDEVTSVEPVRYPRGSSMMRHLGAPLIDPQGSIWRRLGRFMGAVVRQPYDFLKAGFLPDWARDSTILLVMQTLENKMHLRRGRNVFTLFRRGLVTERDDKAPIPTVIAAGRQVVEMFAQKVDGVALSTINEMVLNKPSTAHILGGCEIGRNAEDGVVDVNHEVFGYPGLYVVDGSVIPANLGVNPSLTITALAERAMERIGSRGKW